MVAGVHVAIGWWSDYYRFTVRIDVYLFDPLPKADVGLTVTKM